MLHNMSHSGPLRAKDPIQEIMDRQRKSRRSPDYGALIDRWGETSETVLKSETSETSETNWKVEAYSGNDFLKLDIPKREAILSPWMRSPSLNMLHAWRGVGKTQLSVAIAIAVAAGGRIGPWECTSPKKVVYVDGEMDAGDLQERFRSQAHGRDLSNLTMIADGLHVDGVPDLSSEAHQQKVTAYTEEGSLLILDNISTLFPSLDENEARAWAGPAKWLRNLRRDGVTVLLIHHDNKSGKQRGTSKKEDILNVVIGIRHPEDYDPSEGARFEVHYEKTRGMVGSDADPFGLALQDDDDGRSIWLTFEPGKDDKDEAEALLREGKTIREVAQLTGLHRSSVGRLSKRISQS